jgi:alpha-tubulin suppressor-like RCC1 family protein
VNTDGALARIGEGEFDGQTSYVDIVTDANGNHEKKIKTTGIIEQHFLRPKPVMFAHRPTITPKVIEVACGLTHILVIARDPTSPVGNLYTSGLNCSGQLGHGDTVSRNVLALVCRQIPHQTFTVETALMKINIYLSLFIYYRWKQKRM